MPLLLVVEDQANHRKVIQGVLESQGYEVCAVKDAALARAALKPETALVLTDLKLPGEDGLSLLKGLKKDRPGLPVILMTAFGTIPAAVEAVLHLFSSEMDILILGKRVIPSVKAAPCVIRTFEACPWYAELAFLLGAYLLFQIDSP